MPWGPSSAANEWAILCACALPALYSLRPAKPMRLDIDVMLTMAPRPRATMCGATKRDASNVP
jgi:hypothetical protein